MVLKYLTAANIVFTNSDFTYVKQAWLPSINSLT
jgi:hypothetical protein